MTADLARRFSTRSLKQALEGTGSSLGSGFFVASASVVSLANFK